MQHKKTKINRGQKLNIKKQILENKFVIKEEKEGRERKREKGGGKAGKQEGRKEGGKA